MSSYPLVVDDRFDHGLEETVTLDGDVTLRTLVAAFHLLDEVADQGHFAFDLFDDLAQVVVLGRDLLGR